MSSVYIYNVSLVDNEFSSKYCCIAYNHNKERIELPPPLTQIEMKLQ